ncbi:hypothetical protein NEOLEDRAFT_1143613 [Neolentinus lepideus HHB14362 ss-1]|uniref:Uncharacterized protein n=1 Tax=Neolentinus lepideus HHB14362 ss-1 TaxID=1314782 RepID=A0A165MFA7_9AGAM|nr:hypothetical protein NEOLEDRAFT_1143613 [Neolentinus lepideus HHB14362 ss-1]
MDHMRSGFYSLRWLDSTQNHKADTRLVQFVIDRRFHFSVRLTAAYYLILVLLYGLPSNLPYVIPHIHDALTHLC